MKILVCPLNWGLGHATRCVLVIRKILADKHEPVIVSDGYPLQFLKQEFPNVRFIEYPSYSVQYASGNSQIGAMILNFPKIIKGIIAEHFWLKKLLQQEHFDKVISDNRFGLWTKNTHAIYITHQIMVKMPQSLRFFEPLIYRLHKKIIEKYSECWIPDSKEEGGLSGDLSHKYPLPENAKFIGPLSRFEDMESMNVNTNYEVVGLISGIEPQRTIFENSLIQQYKNAPYKTLLVQGQPNICPTEKQLENITLISQLPDRELAEVIKGAKKIICRSGYSSIMDLKALNCLQKAELIPTPGQTEQEYLKSFHELRTNDSKTVN